MNARKGSADALGPGGPKPGLAASAGARDAESAATIIEAIRKLDD
jgi:hypothetical protein